MLPFALDQALGYAQCGTKGGYKIEVMKRSDSMFVPDQSKTASVR